MKFFEYYIKIEKDKFSSLFKYIMNKYFNNDYLSYLPFDKKKNLVKIFSISDIEYLEIYKYLTIIIKTNNNYS